MKFVELKVGDTAWLYVGNHKGKYSKGVVKMIIDVPGWSYLHYVIEIPTHIENLLEIRCGYSVSENPDKAIGMYRNA